MKTLTCLLVLVACLQPSPLTAATIRVPADQPSLKAGIEAARDGDTVLVADGLWRGPQNRNLDFGGKVITVRSENGPEACRITGHSEDRVFYFRSGEDTRSILEGFEISNSIGGGILCENGSSPTIRNNHLINCVADLGGGILITVSSPRIMGNAFKLCGGRSEGGAIHCHSGCPIIEQNNIQENNATWGGGGIVCLGESSPLITGNLIANNSSGFGPGGGIVVGSRSKACISLNIIRNNRAGGDFNGGGGGISVQFASPVIAWNTIEGNHTATEGGGIAINSFGDEIPVIANCLIINNAANWKGGGLYCRSVAPLIMELTTLAGNTSADGQGIYLAGATHFTVTNSIIWDNDIVLSASAVTDISYSDVQHGWTGKGTIDADPLFVQGEQGRYYLSQLAAGELADSPCIDTGDPDGPPGWGLTRTDHVHDRGVMDMGFHWPGPERLVLGPGAGPQNPSTIEVIMPAVPRSCEHLFTAYGAGGFGVNLSCGDLDGDQLDEILTGAGPGAIYGPHVRGWNVDGTPLPGLSFLAYGTNNYGVNVAAGDTDADGFDEIITGAGPGEVFGPHVRGWDYDGYQGITSIQGVNYFAYGTPRWGVNVAAGDIDGDGFDEIITGAGPGAVYGPHVRGWNVDGGAAAAMPGVSFLAYGTNKFGVNVTCGDMDGDGMDEIITGAGPGAVFGPHVRGWNYDGLSITPLPGFSFFAWDTEPLRFGVTVFAGADLNNDGRYELVTGRGPDPDADTEVKVFTYDGADVSQWLSLEAFPGLTHGTNVAAGKF